MLVYAMCAIKHASSRDSCERARQRAAERRCMQRAFRDELDKHNWRRTARRERVATQMPCAGQIGREIRN